jgi:hypothetical protein
MIFVNEKIFVMVQGYYLRIKFKYKFQRWSIMVWIKAKDYV